MLKNAGQGSYRVRKALAKEYARALAGRLVFYGMAAGFLWAMLGAPDPDDPEGWDLTINPFDPDFGKLRIQERRIDLAGGLGSATRFLTRMSANTVNGIWKLFGGEISEGSQKEMDAHWRTVGLYGKTKFVPAVGIWGEVSTGEEYGGADLTPEKLIVNTIAPMTPMDISESLDEFGIGGGAAAGMLAFFGAGGNSYGPMTKYRNASEEDQQKMLKEWRDIRRGMGKPEKQPTETQARYDGRLADWRAEQAQKTAALESVEKQRAKSR